MSKKYARADERRGKDKSVVPRATETVALDRAALPPTHTEESSRSLARVMECNAQGLWRFFLIRVGGDENLAEDLMQELCLQATRSYTPDQPADNPDGWLYGVARNVLRRHWRTIARRRKNLPEARADVGVELVSILDGAAPPMEHLERREVQEQVLLAVTSLSTEEQNLILEHYFDGRSQNDMASTRGVTARAIEGRLYRARLALRDKLQHLHEWD